MATFTGSAIGRHQRKADGTWDLTALGVNVIRNQHFVNVGGVFRRMTRFDSAATNRLLNSATPASQTPPDLPAGTYCLWVEGTGSCVLSGGATGTAIVGVPVVFTLGATASVTFTKTGSLSVFQCEAGSSPTSFIATAGASVTRGAERWFTPMDSTTVQEMTFYQSMYEPGNIGFGNLTLMHVGTATGTASYWRVESSSTNDRIRARLHDGTTAQATANNGVGLVFTDHVEVIAKINVAGTHSIQTIRNGVEDAVITSGVFTLPATFSAAQFNLGGTDVGSSLPMSVDGPALLVLGIQTLATMRTLAALPVSLGAVNAAGLSRIHSGVVMLTAAGLNGELEC